MPTPVPARIAGELVRRLEQITIANGYEFDVADVVRPSRIEEKAFAHQTIVISEPTLNPVPELSHSGNPPALCWRMSVNINCILRDDETSTTSRMADQYKVMSDVISAVADEAVAPAVWHTWDGDAINTTWGTITDFQADDGSGHGVSLTLNVDFRVDENDMYIARA